ncbi:hypothetical protein MC7420_1030 [Coleofasciculus chthonoplastes PCC 7420]|uniref:Uncharacterized protein n=1 Tax=Coleofasciculus chthonoplastes PCC 7420 TaxID=118168 RepID=B4W0I4_9CYAN|nr:hypothetical protein MC7420_1030 [Coleofasciculus chthonoplastes PCC 7420]
MSPPLNKKPTPVRGTGGGSKRGERGGLGDGSGTEGGSISEEGDVKGMKMSWG